VRKESLPQRCTGTVNAHRCRVQRQAQLKRDIGYADDFGRATPGRGGGSH
jgi:hypothetical protein